MIDRVLEWHRIVNVRPSPETIQRRKAACMTLVNSFAKANNWKELAGMTAGVVAGFEAGHAADAPHVEMILGALRAEDPTVPQDLAENRLELRAAGAVALGELMAHAQDTRARKAAVMASMFIDSGTGIRTQAAGRHLAELLSELREIARQVSNGAQQRRRRSAKATANKIPTFGEEQTDVATNIKALAVAVKSAMKELAEQSMIDREELDILWWLYAGITATGMPYSELAPGKAAFVAGCEVANLCLLPPLVNANGFVCEAMSKVKKADSKRTIEKIVNETDSEVWSLLRSDSLADQFPSLFPLSWLCGRLTSSSGAASWSAEFQGKTGIDPSQNLSSVDFAVQVFRERIAQRQFASCE